MQYKCVCASEMAYGTFLSTIAEEPYMSAYDTDFDCCAYISSIFFKPKPRQATPAEWPEPL